jgi:Flp pilus assembly protein TadG
VKPFVRFEKGPWPRWWSSIRASIDCDGSAAAEFALVAPIIILIAVGVADIGMITAKSAALTATTRVGSEYARLNPADTPDIQKAMQDSTAFMPALSYPPSFPESCECDDRTPIACTQSCAAAGRPGPNRVFITITATQAFIPLVPWPGLPATLTSVTKVRLQ